ncbi:MAG: hypothetical protein ABSG97_09390 [Sedimentisphaerales bacterium]|jgi:hypothetical protein
MEPSENNKTVTGKKTGKKIFKIVLGTVLVLLLLLILLVAFVVPAYVSSDSARKLILSKANASGAGAIDFAKLSMSWFKGISVSNISFKNTDQGVSVAVKGVSTMPNYGALLAGNLSFGETVIDEPKVEIDVDKMKQKAAETQKTAAKPAAKSKTETSAGLPIKKIDLVVKDGDVKIKDKRGEVEVSNINTKVALLGPGEKTTLALDASIAGQGVASTVTARGDVTPGKNWDLSKATANITADVNNLNLSQLESILAIAGVDVTAKGTVSAHLKGELKNGIVENAGMDMQGSSLEITAPQLKGDTIKTGVLNIAMEMSQQGNLVNIKKMSVATDWLRAEASGTAPIDSASVSEFMKPDSKYELKANLECDLPVVAAMLPKTLGLKEQTKLTGGKLLGSVQTLSEAGTKKLAGQVSIEGLAGMVEGKPISLSEPIQAQAKITTEGNQIKFEKAGVSSAFATVNCTGTMETFNYDAQLDLAKLASELGQFADLGKYKLAGQLSAAGQLTNNAKTTMVVCRSSISNLRASPTADIAINEPNTSIALTAAIDKTTNVLLIKQLKADTSLGQFSVNDGRLPMGKDVKEPISLTASVKGLDLAKVQPYLVMTKAISKDVVLGGVVESDITVNSKDGGYRITTDTTKIANLLVKSPGKQAFIQNPVAIVLDAEVNPTTKTLVLNNAEITSPDIKIKASFQQKIEGQNSSIEGTAKLDYDWKTITSMLSPFMPAGLTIEGKRQDSISFASKYPTKDANQMLANLNAQAKVGFDKVGYMGLSVGTTNVDIKVDKGFMTIAPFTSVVNNGQFNFGGSADFKQKPAVFRTPGSMNIIKDVQINKEMADKLLAKVNPVFFGVSSITGAANFQCDKLAVPINGGKPEDANIAGTISLTQVKMQSTGLMGAILSATGASDGQLITLHPTPFTVRDGFVKYSDMQMDIGTMPINFSGTVPIDPNRKIESFSVTLPISPTGKIAKAGSQGTAGTIVHIKGTPNKPTLDIGKMIQDNAVQTGLDLLMQGAQKRK